MGMASSKMYVPGNEKEAKEYFSKNNDDRKDTNIICIGFSILKQDPKNLIQNGDPILCGNCKVGFNCYSESAQKNSENNRVWDCEFCGCLNKLLIDENEIPKKEDCLYMIEAPLQKQGDLNDNLNIILCIDFSGSMSVTKEIKGKLDFKHSSIENLDDFKAFMEPWEFLEMKRNLENEAKNKTFVTRKQCVLAAIESQLNEMCTDTPNRKVGIVGFNNEVIVIGDGSKNPTVITGDKLQNYEILLQEGLDSAGTHLNTPISHSATKLFESLDKLKETGQTALGPALLVALGMASKGSHGSKLIVCTDGLANVGLGSLDNDINNSQFYDRIKEYANQSGVSINVITMKGEDCKLDVLGSLADNTNGKILRVDPENLNQDFANVIKGEILATKVELKVFLHKALEFRNEGEGEFMNNGTIYRKVVGNVTEKSEVSFEYDLKNPQKLKEFGLDMKALKKLPFQAQVTYTTHQGKFLRIMSKFQEVSNKIEEVEREASIPMIANRAIKKSVKETLSNKKYFKFLHVFFSIFHKDFMTFLYTNPPPFLSRENFSIYKRGGVVYIKKFLNIFI